MVTHHRKALKQFPKVCNVAKNYNRKAYYISVKRYHWILLKLSLLPESYLLYYIGEHDKIDILIYCISYQDEHFAKENWDWESRFTSTRPGWAKQE